MRQDESLRKSSSRKSSNSHFEPFHSRLRGKENCTRNWSKLVKLVTKLTLQRDAARTDQERTVFNRQIEATDRQIDKQVYKLYALTEKEIAIVESSVIG